MNNDSVRSPANAGPGCQPTASAAISVASSRSDIPNAAWPLRTEPDPARLSCWCGGWGHFHNTAKDPPELTYCGNCEDANSRDSWAHLSELEQDLKLARLGDYPGSAGCKRIAAAYDELASAIEAQRVAAPQSDAVHESAASEAGDAPTVEVRP